MDTKNNINIVGTNVKRLRQMENWPQAVVAAKLNISIPAFSKIETGFTDCNLSRIRQIAEIFSVNVIEIIIPMDEYSKINGIDEIIGLKELLRIKEQEIIKLQSRTISLYQELVDMK
jgi:transcriptional regulator with XRE-family HTH domain